MKRLIACVLALCALLAAQTPVVVANLAPVPRGPGWVTIVVPHDRLPKLPWRAGQWQAFAGETWGPRARLVHLRHGTLAPFEHATVTLETASSEGPSLLLPEASDPRAAASFTSLLVRVPSSGTQHRIPLIGGGQIEVVESITRTVVHTWGRVPESMLVWHAWFGILPGSRVVELEFLVGNSDPRSPAFVQPVDAIALETDSGVWPVLDYHTRRGGLPSMPAGQGLVTPLVHAPTWLGDGQALAWRGRLLLLAGSTAEERMALSAELRGPVLGTAKPEVWQGSWGPWGVLPALHPNEATEARGYGQRGAIELWQRFASKAGRPDSHPSGAIFCEPDWGNGWRPPQAGDHWDFGVTGGAPALSPRDGNPSHLFDVGHAVLYELLRPSYWYEADGNPLRVDDHPQMVTWGLKNHWHPGKSPDRLGKGIGAGDDHNAVEFQDWSHLSANSIYAWCQLTPSHMGKHMLGQMETGWLLGSRVNEGLSEPRGWGRTMMAMAWSWCVTGNERVVARLRDRWKVSFGEYLTRKEHAVAAFGPYPPDPRQLGGVYPFVFGWQEALALNGFDAAFWLCYVANPGDEKGKAEARDVCANVARTLVDHCWWFHKGRWTVAYALRYDQGRALDPSAYEDESQVTPHWPGTSVDRDAGGSLIIARRWLVEAGGQEALVGKCDQILGSLRAYYEGPNGQEGQAFTRWSTWSATR